MHLIPRGGWTSIILSLCFAATTVRAGDEWTIVLGHDAQPPEQTAAQIIKDALATKKLPARICDETAGGWQHAKAIVLGTPTSSDAIKSMIESKSIDLPHMPEPDPQDDSYLARRVDATRIVLASSKSRGVLYAACDLEQNLDHLSDLNIRMIPKFSLRIVTLPVKMTDASPNVIGGPWSNFEGRSDNFERFVKWCAQHRYNCVLGGASAYFPPMQFIDYSKTKYPEAQQYSAPQVQANVEHFRANAQLVHKYGMDVIINNFTLLAPKKYVLAHKELQTPFLNKHEAGLETKLDYVGNLCWNNPEYKQFWTDSYQQMFRALPELDGLLMAYAEWIYCNDERCQQRGFVATAIDFIKTAQDLVKQQRGEEGIYIQRDWYLVAPQKGVTYLGDNKNVFLDPTCPRVPISFKMAGFDAATTQPDPWIADYTKLGHGAVAWLRVTDTENTRPLHWCDIDFYREMIANLLKMHVTAVSVASPIEELERCDDMGQFVMIDAIRNYLWGQDYTEKDAIAELKQWYGPAAPHVYKALEHAAHVMTEYPKLVTGEYGGGDGITGHAVSLGTLPMIPVIWKHVQRDAVGVVEYVDYLKADASHRAQIEMQWKQSARITPPQLLDRLCDEARLSLQEIRQARALAPNSPQIDRMVCNSVIVNHLAQAYRDHIMGAIEFAVSGGNLNRPKTAPGPALLDRAPACEQDWLAAFREMAIVAKATNAFVKDPRSDGIVREEVYKNPLRDYAQALASLKIDLGAPARPDIPQGSIWVEGESFEKPQGWRKSTTGATALFGGECIKSEGGPEDRASTITSVTGTRYAVWARTLGEKASDTSFWIALGQGGKQLLRAQAGTAKPYRSSYVWTQLGQIEPHAGDISIELIKEKANQTGLDAMLLVAQPAGKDFRPREAALDLEPSIEQVRSLISAQAAGAPIPAAPTAQAEADELISLRQGK